MADKKLECFQAIDKFYEQYKDNDYVLQRIHTHIVSNLQTTLENEAKNYEKRINLNSYLSEEQQIFMQVFLSKNNYYYLPNNAFFYEYNGKDYFIVKEDDIIHKLLSTISKDRILLQWKYKTKINVIKQIKDRNLFQSTPETDTIQSVLNVLYPAIFNSKSTAKYFLTIIGDNILKKNNNLHFLVNSNMKLFLSELESVAISSIGNDNTSSRFITKYHENHSYENLRLIKITHNYSNDYWREMLKKIGLNLLCVAAHYSNRYQNSDNFLNNKLGEEFTNYAYTLKNTTQNDILNKFVNECIEKTNDDYQIEWRNLHFVWKQFLSNHDLPNVIFSTTLKTLLAELFLYDKDSDTFKGVTSKYLPYYKDFIQFWNSTIVNSDANTFEDELEIDEISSLFKQWSKSKNILSEENIIRIIRHFFSSEIVDEKYVLNVVSLTWNKSNDINKSIEFIKENIRCNHELALVSFDSLYNYYQKFCSVNSLKFIVSKRYFEKYLYNKFTDYIVYEKFIKTEWADE